QATPSASQLAIQLFLFFVSVPFMFLAVLVNYQRKTEKSLRESEERFRSMMDTAPVMIWLAGPDGRCSFFNKSWLDFTGRSLPEELGDGWAAGVHPDDRGRWAARYTSALKARAGLTREYRLMRKDRVYRWVLESAAPRSGPNGEPLGYIGSCIDITDRKETEDRMRELSAQLVHAQEAERFRIGQELHDDLSQRAAALSMGLKRLALRYDEGIRPPFEELQQQAADLSLGISNISHQLRPPALETLGLAAALKSLCAQSTSDTVRVTMSSNAELPPLSDDVAISLYRVAQEAIRNALTHSGAALVDLELNLSDSDVQLSITDAGSGFVVDSRALPGLGLSGMSERMKNLGGTLRVVSAPSRGTAITATVPRHKALSATARAS
ncbi:MAG TPA: PAS domain S-box protein, partial [Terriglobia bacterium]|nr:PAS domain S-box protein [Terriglobia bacterium]